MVPHPTAPEDTHLLSIAAMVSNSGTFRVSVRKQVTATPAKTEVAPKDTGGRMGLISPSVVIRGAAKPPRRALTEAKPIPICLWEVQTHQQLGLGPQRVRPAGVRKESGHLPGHHSSYPPDLCGIEFPCEQVHTDEGAGQAAFAQRRLHCPQGLQI